METKLVSSKSHQKNKNGIVLVNFHAMLFILKKKKGEMLWE